MKKLILYGGAALLIYFLYNIYIVLFGQDCSKYFKEDYLKYDAESKPVFKVINIGTHEMYLFADGINFNKYNNLEKLLMETRDYFKMSIHSGVYSIYVFKCHVDYRFFLKTYYCCNNWMEPWNHLAYVIQFDRNTIQDSIPKIRSVSIYKDDVFYFLDEIHFSHINNSTLSD